MEHEVFTAQKRTRLIVNKGLERISLKVEELALIYTENRVVFVIDILENKFLCDRNMMELERELDPSLFFRANRQYIINVNNIRSFRPYERVKILVNLNLTKHNHQIIISQLTAPYFRKWIYEV